MVGLARRLEEKEVDVEGELFPYGAQRGEYLAREPPVRQTESIIYHLFNEDTAQKVGRMQQRKTLIILTAVRHCFDDIWCTAVALFNWLASSIE